MMPLTTTTCFDYIGRELIGAPMKFSQLFIVGDDFAVGL
jgi:hypothetical protein